FRFPACDGRGANAGSGTAGRRIWNSDSDHLHPDHSWSNFNGREYDFRNRYQVCECGRKKNPGFKTEKPGASCEKCSFYAAVYISCLCHCSVWTDDSRQQRIRLSWICGADYTVYPICTSCGCHKRKRDLTKKGKRKILSCSVTRPSKK